MTPIEFWLIASQCNYDSTIHCENPADFPNSRANFDDGRIIVSRRKRKIATIVFILCLCLVVLCIVMVYLDHSWLSFLYEHRTTSTPSSSVEQTKLVCLHDRRRWMWAHLQCMRAILRLDFDNDCTLCHQFWYHQTTRMDFQLAYESYRRFFSCDSISSTIVDANRHDQDACICEWYREWSEWYNKTSTIQLPDYTSYRIALLRCCTLQDLIQVHNDMRMNEIDLSIYV
jgi:hypothetical protein